MDVMTVNNSTYPVQRLLGRGKGGYSYLVGNAEQRFVIKQIHHEPCDYYTFGNKLEAEQTDYLRLRSAGIRVPELLDVDVQQERILKAYIDGPTVYDLVLHDALPQELMQQGHDMAAQARAAGLNIDYFPTNFVLQDGLLYYVDYECNAYMEEWSFERWGIQYWSKTEAFLAYAAAHP
ncbi:MAG: hypothetical protein IJZ74_08405 [Clostridia bacterium]|nr:hypothetical protein [Clostridia bacterium]